MPEWKPVEGSERCGECLTWEHLMAWAAALVEGPLGPDGQLTEYSDVEDCFVHDDSIHCTDHMTARIEQFHKGRWCYWWTCPTCKGTGKIRTGEPPWSTQEWRCPDGRKAQDRDIVWVGDGGRIHAEWRSVDEPLVAAS